VDRRKTRWEEIPPEERRRLTEPAAEGRRRVGTSAHVRAIVARAGKLTPEQLELLRSVLPAPDTEAAS
jgi:hypothetical protein